MLKEKYIVLRTHHDTLKWGHDFETEREAVQYAKDEWFLTGNRLGGKVSVYKYITDDTVYGVDKGNYFNFLYEVISYED